jgi:hypothetical protein
LKSTSRLDTDDKSRQRIQSANGKTGPEQHSHADYGVGNIFTTSRHVVQNDLGTFVGFQKLMAELVLFLEESDVELLIRPVAFPPRWSILLIVDCIMMALSVKH